MDEEQKKPGSDANTKTKFSNIDLYCKSLDTCVEKLDEADYNDLGKLQDLLDEFFKLKKEDPKYQEDNKKQVQELTNFFKNNVIPGSIKSKPTKQSIIDDVKKNLGILEEKKSKLQKENKDISGIECLIKCLKEFGPFAEKQNVEFTNCDLMAKKFQEMFAMGDNAGLKPDQVYERATEINGFIKA